MNTKEFPYYKEKIPVEKLYLDRLNPRLPEYLHDSNESVIIEHMLLEESTLELMQAIGEKGFFQGEMLLVVEDKNKNFKVVEGNRRLTAVKLLNDPSIAPAQQSLVNKIQKEAEVKEILNLPCMVFEHENEIHDYLGYRHVTGIQPWNLRQKAKYVSYLREQNYKELPLSDAADELRKIIGSKKNYVKRLIVGHEIYQIIKDKKFFGIENIEEKDLYFSYISDSLSRTNISSFLGVDFTHEDPVKNVDLDKLEQWTYWFFDPLAGSTENRKKTKVKGTSSDLNKLNQILGNKNAYREFVINDKSLEQSYAFTIQFNQSFKQFIDSANESLVSAHNMITRVNQFPIDIDDSLKEVIQLARSIKASKDKLTSSEFEGDEF